MLSPNTWRREPAPLRSIRDSYEKMAVERQGRCESDADGIRMVSARDFLLGRLSTVGGRPLALRYDLPPDRT